MRSLFIFFLSLIIFHQNSFCQTQAKITDVDFYLEGRNIVVKYNISGSLPKEQLTIELKFISENFETITPKTVSGDVGTKVYGNGLKSILWDIAVDEPLISGNIKASLFIKSSEILYSGPSNALLSVLVPGLGGYYVDTHKARSIITTISTVGLITYGISKKLQEIKYYKEYNSSIIDSEIQSLFSKANDAQHKYYVATRVGAGLWVMDIIWVTLKGFHNKKEAKSAYSSITGDGLRLNYVNNGLQLGYSMSF